MALSLFAFNSGSRSLITSKEPSWHLLIFSIMLVVDPILLHRFEYLHAGKHTLTVVRGIGSNVFFSYEQLGARHQPSCEFFIFASHLHLQLKSCMQVTHVVSRRVSTSL